MLHLPWLDLYKFTPLAAFIFCLLASCVSLLKPSQALSFASSCLLVCQCWSLLRLCPLPPLGFLCVTAEAFSGFILCLLLASCVSVLKPSQALSFASSCFFFVSAEAFSGFILCCHCWQIWICSMGLFQTSTWAAIFLPPSQALHCHPLLHTISAWFQQMFHLCNSRCSLGGSLQPLHPVSGWTGETWASASMSWYRLHPAP